MRRARHILLLLLSAAFVLPSASPLRAQWQVMGDVGGSALRQGGIPTSGALTGGATLDLVGERAWLRSSALLSRAGENGLTGQGVAIGAVSGEWTARTRWELSGLLSTFGESRTFPTSSAELLGRLQFGSSIAGMSLGGGAGRTSHARQSGAVRRGDISGWWSFANEHLLLDAAFIRTPMLTVLPTDVAKYIDVIGSWQHDHGALTAALTAGARHATSVDDGIRGWSAAELATWVTPHLAIVASAGSTLADPVRGTPQARFVGVSVRIAARARGAALVHAGATNRFPRLVVVTTTSGDRRIEVTAPGATQVELLADFTDWTPVALERVAATDVWTLDRTLSPGLHRVAVRIDGGEWTAPLNLPRGRDDLGGVAGLVTVP